VHVLARRPDWAKPVRAARESASADVLWEDARVYSFGDTIGFGGSTAVAATGGSVHPLWIDTSDLEGGGRRFCRNTALTVF
jgi:hypothetical protein